MLAYSFEVYHTYGLRIVSIVLYTISTCLSIPIFISLCYLVATKSFSLGDFKHYILYTAVTNFLYSIILVIWIPIPLYPCFAGFSIGLLSKFGNIGSYVGFTLAVWILIKISVKIYIIFLERVLTIIMQIPTKNSLR